MSLFDDYLAGADALRPFFRGFPQDALEEVPRLGEITPELRESMARHQERLGVPKEVPGRCAVVATGQQTGLFAGPMYTIYKAITAIKLAVELERRHGVPCVPLFWCASEDHDFAECATAFLQSKDDEPVGLTYAPKADVQDVTMARVPVEQSLYGLIDEAARVTRSSENGNGVRTMLDDTLGASDSLADWFARIMARLFKDSPLLIFAPDWDAARIASRPILARALERPLATSQAVMEAGASLRAMGHEAQLDMAADQPPFFLELDGRRCAVTWAEGRFNERRTGLRLEADEARKLLDGHPSRFSPNAALRPVVQQALFPVHAYVGGPGEVAYWAQLKGVFAHFGQPMPHVYPRARAVITREKLRRWQREYELSYADLERPLQELELPALAALPLTEAVAKMQELDPQLRKALEAFRQGFADQQGPPTDMAQAIERNALDYLDRMNRTLLRMDEERRTTVRRRIARLQGALAPHRKPQERVYCVLSYLFEHGWQLVPWLMAGLDVENFGLQEIEL